MKRKAVAVAFKKCLLPLVRQGHDECRLGLELRRLVEEGRW